LTEFDDAVAFYAPPGGRMNIAAIVGTAVVVAHSSNLRMDRRTDRRDRR
jgi:hypothetical protein